MAGKYKIPGPLCVAVIAAVTLALLLVNLHGYIDPQPGTLSQQKWAHGWPLPWLKRTWFPHIEDSQWMFNPRHLSWPWVKWPVQRVTLLVSGMLVDLCVAGVLLGVAAWRFWPRPAGWRSGWNVLALATLLAAVWFQGRANPEPAFLVAQVCVYGAAVLAAWQSLAFLIRRMKRA